MKRKCLTKCSNYLLEEIILCVLLQSALIIMDSVIILGCSFLKFNSQDSEKTQRLKFIAKYNVHHGHSITYDNRRKLSKHEDINKALQCNPFL